MVIDRVAGVSMGAFIGGLFAMGLDADEIDARCFEEWVQRRPLGDYTFPRHALIRGERARAMLERTFGDVAIEELARSFMSGATELRSGRLEVARWGPLYEAVGFSLCLPIVAPPQVRGREMFIDGSLVDNLPVGVMAGLGEGPVIAVDVKASFGARRRRPRVDRRAAAAEPRRDAHAGAAARQREHVRGRLPPCRPRHQPAGTGSRPARVPPDRRSPRGRSRRRPRRAGRDAGAAVRLSRSPAVASGSRRSPLAQPK